MSAMKGAAKGARREGPGSRGKKPPSPSVSRVVRARDAAVQRKNLALQQRKIDRLKALIGATTDQATMEIALDRALGQAEADAQIREAFRQRWAAADRGELHTEEAFPARQLPPDARRRLEDAGVELAALRPAKRYSAQ